MNFILVIWTVVAIHGSQYGTENYPRMDWRPIGEFKGEQACQEAARLLVKNKDQFRCLPTNRP